MGPFDFKNTRQDLSSLKYFISTNIVHGDAWDILILGWNTNDFSLAIREVLPIGALDKPFSQTFSAAMSARSLVGCV